MADRYDSMRNPPSLIGMLNNKLKGLKSDLTKPVDWDRALANQRSVSTQDMIDLADSIGGMGGLAGVIKFVHGSPHKFKAFDSTHMGKGEGAQAAGAGHYSGENVPAIDSWYRDRLINMYDEDAVYDLVKKNMAKIRREIDPRIKGSDEFGIFDTPISQGVDWRTSPSKDIDKVLDDNIMQMTKLSLSENEPMMLSKTFESILGSNKRVGPGYTYTGKWDVEPEDIIHFEKSIGAHPDNIRKELAPYAGDDLLNATARKAYRKMQKEKGHLGVKDFLSEKGIPGHSFPGQGGKGDPNYVMYNDKDIGIVRRVRGGLDSPSPRAKKYLLDYIDN